MTTSHYDTIIVGGGIIGVLTAWRLAQEKHNVLVLEANRLGSGATRAGAGMLGAQVEMEQPGPLYDLCIYSRSLFDELDLQLKEQSHIDIELDKTGLFRIATTASDREELISRMHWQRASGQPVEWLEPASIPAELKGILGAHYGALYLPLDYQVRNPQFLSAAAVAARRSGVTLLEHSPVEAILRSSEDSNQIIGVKTLTDHFYSSHVILAAGAWSGMLAKSLHLELGVYPIKGQAVMVNSEPHLTPYTVFTHGTYLVPKHVGQTYIGATEDSTGFDPRPLNKNVRHLLSSAEKIIPGVDELEFSSTFTGFRPASHDGLPYIGAHPALEGLYIASGHWRNGVLLSAATASIITDLLTGRSPAIDISSFAPDRE